MKYLKLITLIHCFKLPINQQNRYKAFWIIQGNNIIFLHFNFIPNVNDYNLQHNPNSIIITLNKNLIFLNMFGFLAKGFSLHLRS